MNYLRLLFIALLCSFSLNCFSQFYSARTNLVGLTTGNLNAEFGVTLNKKLSLHFPVQYNPFVYSKSNNTKFQNLTVMPAARYWFGESFREQFLSFSLIGSQYNISNIWDNYRYEGYAVGAGLSFGWAYPISSRWNMEWEVGGAGVWASYDKYVCKTCGYNFGKESKWYFIPHKVAVNLIYLF